MKLKYPITLVAFMSGWVARSGFGMALQDWFGLEQWIVLIREHWIHMSWVWGALILFVAFWFMGAAGYMEDRLRNPPRMRISIRNTKLH